MTTSSAGAGHGKETGEETTTAGPPGGAGGGTDSGAGGAGGGGAGGGTDPGAGGAGGVAAIKAWGSMVVTILIFIAFFWTLYYVFKYINNPVTKDAAGNVKNTFGNAKDILLIVGALTTTAAGYWFGSDGKSKAEAVATTATNQATEAQQVATTAVKDAAASKALLDHVRATHPQAFTNG